MTSLANLRARYMLRPLLMSPSAADELAKRLAAADPRGMKTENRFLANLRKLNIFRPSAMEDDDDGSESREPHKPACYTPLWAQQAYGDPKDEGFGWALYEGVALMEIDTALTDRGFYSCGVWYHGYDTVMAAFREAAADDRVKGIFVRAASPGGVVAGGLADLAAYIRSMRAAAGGKPVYFYCDMACSAMYWIVAQGDRVSGPRVALVGSIGAVIVHEDWSGAYEQAGCVVTAVQFGAHKTDGAHWKALSPAALADLQSEIDQCGHDFIADVVAGRPKLTSEALLATEARVFMGENADAKRSGLALGFLDAIESEEEAFAVLLADIDARASAATITLPAGSPASSPAAQTETAMLKTAQIMKPKAEDTSRETPVPADDGESGEDDPEEPEDEPKPAPEADDADDKSASAIAASPEAKSHPQQALAAISAGLSLGQFKAMVAAAPAEAAAARKTSALGEAMAGVKRVGADVPAKTAGHGSALLANAKARAG